MAFSKQVSSESYIEEMLTCSICFELLRNPHTLQQCFHSFCKVCVQELIKRQADNQVGILCPVCRSFSKSDEVRSNFFINDLLDLHKNITNKEGKQKLCQQCSTDDKEDKAGEALYKCLDCKINLCKICHKTHMNIPLLKGHRILPLHQETEMIVDHLVFCELHTNEPIKFYCSECNFPICITCKVTEHENHKTETIEKALEYMIPEVEKYVKNLDENAINYKKTKTEIDKTINKLGTSFERCCQDINDLATDFIAKIKEEATQSKAQLRSNKDAEIQKLKDAHQKIESKEREEEHIKFIARTCIERARHATLLTELVQGQIRMKLKEHIRTPRDHSSVNIHYPCLRKTVLPEKLLDIDSTLTYTNQSISMNFTTHITKHERLWNTDCDILKQQWKKELSITLPKFCLCTRISLINNKVWASLTLGNKIQVYSMNGQLEIEMAIESPRNIVQIGEDIIVAGLKGLYEVKFMARKLFTGEYSDVAVQYHTCELYALEYRRNLIYIFSNQNSTNNWTLLKQFPLVANDIDNLTTIMPFCQQSGKNVHLVAYRKASVIAIYDEKWKYLNQISGNFSAPYLCGMDTNGSVLIADRVGCTLQKLNTVTQLMEAIENRLDISGVFDVRLDSMGQCLWIVQYNLKIEEFELLKYTL